MIQRPVDSCGGLFSCAAFALTLLCSACALLLCYITSTWELKSPFVLSSASNAPKMKFLLRLIKMLRPAIYMYVSFYQCLYHWFRHVGEAQLITSAASRLHVMSHLPKKGTRLYASLFLRILINHPKCIISTEYLKVLSHLACSCFVSCMWHVLFIFHAALL